TGFFREKAKAIQATCEALVQRFGGQVPRDMDDMLTLPRVARKTANVVLTNAYDIPSGIVVDTHVARVAQRLGLVDEEKPEKIETELMDLVPKNEWIFFGPAVILHGRYTCTASSPKCPTCILEDVCEKRGVDGEEASEEGGTMAKAKGKGKAPKKASAPVHRDEDEGSAPTSSRSSAGRTKTSAGGSMKPEAIPESWRAVLAPEFDKPYFKKLKQFVEEERSKHTVFPPEEDVFNALKYTPFDEMKVLLLGQDPYHDVGQAHGLCFSVRPGVKPPPSLVNMFKE